MGHSCKVLSVQTAEPLDGGCGHAGGKTDGYDAQEKEQQVLTDVPFVFKDSATVGGPGNTHQTQPTVWPCPWSSGS